MKKHTCFLVTSLEQGGTETYLLRFLEYFQNEIDATIICKSGMLGVLEGKFRNTDAKIIPIKTGYINFFVWLKIYIIFRKIKFDSVTDLTSNFGGVFIMLAYFAGIKKRVSFYRQSSNHFNENKLRLLYDSFVKHLVYKFSTNILSNSYSAFEFFYPDVYKIDARFEVVYNGINSKSFLNVKENKDEIRKELKISSDKFVIGHVGRVNVAKNHETILSVAKVLTSKIDDVHFLFCGKGTDENSFNKLVKEKKLSNKVHLFGYRKDVSKILKSLDFFIFPSTSEGQPNSLIEAMLFGLPFCASNISAIKESTPKYIHKYLVEPFAVNEAVKIIEDYYKKPYKAPFIQAKDWALLKYDSDIQFIKFFNKL